MGETTHHPRRPQGRKLLPTRLNPLASALGRQAAPRVRATLACGHRVVLPFLVGSNRWITLFTIVIIYVVLASGLNIVVGFTGLLDLGYVAFYAIGAYYGDRVRPGAAGGVRR